jgi:hypothetical protein
MRSTPAAFAWFCIAVLGASCSTPEWPEAGPYRSGYGAVALADLAVLKVGDTASDVMKKMGRPMGEMPLPWWDYYAADHEGSYYRFRFSQRRPKDIEPRDQLSSVELVSGGSEEPAHVVWPAEKLANQPPLRTPGSVTPAAGAPVAPPPGAAGL